MVSIQVACDLSDPLANYVVKEGSMTSAAATYRAHTLHFLRQVLLNPGTLAWVVESDDHDTSRSARMSEGIDLLPNPLGNQPAGSAGGQLIGWAVWTRHGTGSVAQNWRRGNSTVFHKIEAFLSELQTWYIAHPYNNALVDRSHEASVRHIMCAGFDPDVFTEYWQLDGCYVDPAWQRGGAGALALGWGMQQAQAEGVPIVMKASPKGVGLYERAGFRRLKKEGFGDFFEESGEGYWQMVWEPGGCQGEGEVVGEGIGEREHHSA
jgi:GNAT superfamily N-acetyltransferase